MHRASEMLGQQPIAAGSQFQNVEKIGKILRQGKKPQSVPHRRCIHHDVVVFAGTQGVRHRQKRRYFRHSRQCGF